MDAREILVGARALIAGGWTRRAYARTKAGRRTEVDSPSAARFCLWGACDKAAGKPLGPTSKALRVLAACLPPEAEGHVAQFNDAPTTRKKDVLAVLDCAIKKAGA